MNPYLFTITFLLMMSFLTSSEVIRFAQSSLENTCYRKSREKIEVAEELRELSHFEVVREEATEEPQTRAKYDPNKTKSSAKRIARLNINTARPPDNSRLNIYTLIHKEPNDNLPEEFSLYEIIAKVMRALYKDETFFQELPNAEYHILDRLIEKKEETSHFTTPDELATLSLEDPRLQAILFQMLKGTKKSPSLLHYITFDKIDSPGRQSRKISLLFAEPLILEAIFPEAEVVEKLLEKRAEIWAEILYQEEHRLEMDSNEGKGRRGYGKDLQAALGEVLSSSGLKYNKYKEHVFDCTLGEPGTIIFIEDTITKKLIREKFIPPPKPKRRQ